MKLFSIMLLLILSSISVFGHDCECPELTTLQVAAGYVSVMGFFKVLSIGAIAIGLGFMFSGFFRKALAFMKEIIEGLLWLLAIGGLVGSYFIPIEYAWLKEYTVVIAAILFPIAIVTSAKIRGWEENEKSFVRLLTIVWGITAVVYLNSIVGFISIIAFFAVLGFSMGVSQLSYSFGFNDDDELGKVVIVGSFLIIAFIIYKVVGIDLDYINVFESGVLWIGSFASGIGLLIASSRSYAGRNYLIMNLITIIFFISGTAIGLVFGINTLNTMALALLLFYLAGKIVEIEVDSLVGLGFKLILIGIMFGGVWYYLQGHEELMLKYLSITF